ncbi:malate synthase-like [Tubulanus polymorphus]|uniref:malate synthase-like n=1 Tax=Tubulanus polymorphus TaxID=672921 RepID=UPI003DA2BAE9
MSSIYDHSEHVEVANAPPGLEDELRILLNAEAIKFVADLVSKFENDFENLLRKRAKRKLDLDGTNAIPDFTRRDRGEWFISEIPTRLKCRHVDLGDVSPANTQHFVAALKSSAQGIQTDFDDGHCPTWFNQIRGLWNVYRAVHGKIPGVHSIEKVPVLMLRPRAWNMIEHNMLVNGKEVPGPLFDFGLLMFHNARILAQVKSGPFFYLSKLESSTEAKLWNDIFVYTQMKLGLPRGTIKACVLIENILAAFEMEEILYELRDHSAGLNCGMWDYSASIINKFGHRREFVLPDRKKYVSMDRHFLKSYMDLVIQVCHKHGAHVTGGMAAKLVTEKEEKNAIETVCRGKLLEIEAGADGFMVYDLKLVKIMQNLFKKKTSGINQLNVTRGEVNIRADDLLQMPTGGVTLNGLKYNISVGILFIYSWLKGNGHFYFQGGVEDSATAEISRSQVWQWIRHRARLEENGELITFSMVQTVVRTTIDEILRREQIDNQLLNQAADTFLEIVMKHEFPEFITTYLNEEHLFHSVHPNRNSNSKVTSKL